MFEVCRIGPMLSNGISGEVIRLCAAGVRVYLRAYPLDGAESLNLRIRSASGGVRQSSLKQRKNPLLLGPRDSHIAQMSANNFHAKSLNYELRDVSKCSRPLIAATRPRSSQMRDRCFILQCPPRNLLLPPPSQQRLDSTHRICYLYPLTLEIVDISSLRDSRLGLLVEALPIQLLFIWKPPHGNRYMRVLVQLRWYQFPAIPMPHDNGCRVHRRRIYPCLTYT